MSKADSNRCKMTREVQWSNLPSDLLSQISDKLGFIEFLSFRAVCKDWLIASSKSSSEDKTCDSWFLTYGEGSKCSLISNQDKIYTTNIPELDGATCLASYRGWLLLFCNGSMFCFCPFSRAKIELPNCPISELSDHIAAFSSVPTSHDCVIVVISRINDEQMELHLLCKGSNQWSKHNFFCSKLNLDTVRACVLQEGEWHFLDGSDGLVTFDACKPKQCHYYRVVYNDISDGDCDTLNYGICKDLFIVKDMKSKLGLEANVSISTCGMLYINGKINSVIHSESIEAAQSESGKHLKGVWIQPRYIQIAPNQIW